MSCDVIALQSDTIPKNSASSEVEHTQWTASTEHSFK